VILLAGRERLNHREEHEEQLRAIIKEILLRVLRDLPGSVFSLGFFDNRPRAF
jgi:hypothetical protein